MVEAKNKTTAARARIAHKLARYYRATPVHLQGISGTSQPSTSHQSIIYTIQPSEELPNADSETNLTLGTPLMMRRLTTRESPKNPKPSKAENPLFLDPLSFCFPTSVRVRPRWNGNYVDIRVFSTFVLHPIHIMSRTFG